jgi:hypothetical protein
MHHLLYHANCADGFAAACIARHALLSQGVALEHINPQPVNYGDRDQMPLGADQVLYTGDTLTYLDYTPPQNVIDRFLEDYPDNIIPLTIIDHHEKASPLHGYSPGDTPLFRHKKSIPPFKSIFSFIHSGAGLTWKHFFQTADTSPATSLIEWRDLGHAFQQPDHPLSTKALNLHAYLFRCIPREFGVWWKLLSGNPLNHNPSLIEAIAIGARLRVADGCIIASAVNACHWLDFSQLPNLELGTWKLKRIPAVNGLDTGLISDACTELLRAYPDTPFAASWFIHPTTGAAVYSLRSRQLGHPHGHVNVSEIAAAMAPGGGGHPCAAGFQTFTPLPFAS